MPDQITLKRETNLYDDDAIKAVNDKVISQYAVSTTPSSTVAKTATVDGDFTLFKNERISVLFQNANTATSPTLNVANTGAKPIWAYGGPLSASGNTFNWVANSTIEFVYDGSHWIVADSGAVGLIVKYDEKLNQEVIFNKLTNNGAIRGIFMQNGQLYINMDYLQTGTIKLGGANNGNGLQIVYDANGNEIGRWDKDGIDIIYSDLSQSLGAVSYTTRSGSTASASGILLYKKNSTTEIKHLITQSWDFINCIKLPSNSGFNYDVGNAIRSFALPSTSSYPAFWFDEMLTRDRIELDFWDQNSGSTSYTQMARFAVGKKGMHFNYDPVYGGRAGGKPAIKITDSIFEIYGGNNASLVVTSSSGQLNGRTITTTSSSKRYKHNITNKICDELNANRLYELEMKQFVYNEDHQPPFACMAGKTIPGFIAEDVEKVYPAAVIYNDEGKVESWSEAQIIPGMLALIQEQKKQLDEQAERIKRLESDISFIHIDVIANPLQESTLCDKIKKKREYRL